MESSAGKVLSSELLYSISAAAGPSASLARLGLCTSALARQIFQPDFSQQLCRHLALIDPVWLKAEEVSLELLAVCAALRSRGKTPQTPRDSGQDKAPADHFTRFSPWLMLRRWAWSIFCWILGRGLGL
ncbi:unnamed protein product [Effrenium voratum]|nr:unnamed protein product [Effrenium voratum]